MVKAGLTQKQVEHVARLASLPLSSKEVILFQAQLYKVVDYIGKISKAEDGRQRTDDRREKREGRLRNVARKDKRDARILSQKDAVSQGKNVHSGLFVVPAIFEEV